MNIGAFFNDETIKQKYLGIAENHYTRSPNGHFSESFENYLLIAERLLNIPRIVLEIEHQIFWRYEATKPYEAKELSIKFLQSIKLGDDLSRVADIFIYWCLGSEDGNIPLNRPEQIDLLANLRELYKIKVYGGVISDDIWDTAAANIKLQSKLHRFNAADFGTTLMDDFIRTTGLPTNTPEEKIDSAWLQFKHRSIARNIARENATVAEMGVALSKQELTINDASLVIKTIARVDEKWLPVMYERLIGFLDNTK